jgi:hypothetical protein
MLNGDPLSNVKNTNWHDFIFKILISIFAMRGRLRMHTKKRRQK